MKLTYEDTFDPGYKGKMFTVKPAKLSFTLVNDVNVLSPEGDALQKLIEADWKKHLGAFKKAKEQEYLEAIEATEKAINYSFVKELDSIDDVQGWLERRAEAGNKMIEKAMATLESVTATKVEELYNKAADTIDKKYKSKLRSMKVKAGVKIAGYITLAVAGGAFSVLAAGTGVALTFITMGPGALSFLAIVPAVATSLGAAVGAAKKIYDTIDACWVSEGKAIKVLSKSMTELIDAVEYEAKKNTKVQLKQSLGPKEKAKLLFNNVKGKRDAVIKNMELVESFEGQLRQKVEENVAKLGEMQTLYRQLREKALDGPKEYAKQADEQEKKIGAVLYKIDKARKTLADIEAVFVEVRKALDESNLEQVAALKGLLGKIERFANDEDVQQVAVLTKDVVSNAGSFAGVLAKLIPKV